MPSQAMRYVLAIMALVSIAGASTVFAQSSKLMTYYGTVDVAEVVTVVVENTTRGYSSSAAVGEFQAMSWQTTVLDYQGGVVAAAGDEIRVTGYDAASQAIGAPMTKMLSAADVQAGRVRLDVMVTVPVAVVSSRVWYDGRTIRVEWELADDSPADELVLLRRSEGAAWQEHARWRHVTRRGAFADPAVTAGVRYEYGLRIGTEPAVYPLGSVAVPSLSFALMPLVPNPSRGSAEIRFRLPFAAPVHLDVYDAAGRRVRSLVSGATLPAAEHAVVWDGMDDGGRRAPNGVYFVRLRARSVTRVRKLAIVR